MPFVFDVRVGYLNWLFLVYAVAVPVVILSYLFFFGRALAWIVSFILRTILRRRYRIWVDIGSLQISPLGGRVLFRDVKYIAENQRISIAAGTLTWRYWLWRVRRDEDLQREDSRLPCRTSLKVQGAEWFIYNRNPAFDLLLERLGNHEAASGSSKSQTTSHEKNSVVLTPPSNENHMRQDPDAIDWFREALPVEINIDKGAIVMGNRSTPSLAVIGFSAAQGSCGAVKSRSSLDFYKQVYQFSFKKPRIMFRINHDYEAPLLDHGSELLEEKVTAMPHDVRPFPQSLDKSAFQEFLRRWPVFGKLIYRSSLDSKKRRPQRMPEPWQGLTRYREAVAALYESGNSSFDQRHQYGKVSTLYDNGESIDITYYADVAGYVPAINKRPANLSAPPLEKPDIGNVDLSPEWGIDIRLNGGTLTYGPWADRQRVALQHAFFPPAYFHSEPTSALSAGDRRLHTALKIYLDLSQATTFRLPSREVSKDWKYDGNDLRYDNSQRPYAWLDLKMGPDSCVTFVLPMVASQSGYETLLEVHLDRVAIFSSVNYEKFIEARSCRISCQLPQPLMWDALHVWAIHVAVEQAEIFFLRDHAYLLTDVVRDWTSGDTGDADHFVPFRYELDIAFIDYRLHLFLNERNVINNALSLEDNTMLSISGPKFTVAVSVPSEVYRSAFSCISTHIQGHDVALALPTPASNTHQAWLTERTESFGKLRSLDITILHTVFAHPDENNVEILDIDVELNGIMLELLGWVIKYIIEVKDNYFGAYNHFSELTAERQSATGGIRSAVQRKHDLGPPDPFEVHLNLIAHDGAILIPEELHDCRSGLVWAIPAFTVHLRNHDHFMELNVDVDPTELTFCSEFHPIITKHVLPDATEKNGILMDHVGVMTHRLFGPQPHNETYAAMWSFDMGDVCANVTIPHIASLLRIVRTFVANFADLDNLSPPDLDKVTIPDVLFLTAHTSSIVMNVWSLDTAVQVAMPKGVDASFNDYARQGVLSNVQVLIPLAQARGIVDTNASETEWLEVVSFTSGMQASLSKYSTDYQERHRQQQIFLREQDVPQQRCSFLYEEAPRSMNGDQHNGALYDAGLSPSSTSQMIAQILQRSPPRASVQEDDIQEQEANSVKARRVGNPDHGSKDHQTVSYSSLLTSVPLITTSHKQASRKSTFAIQKALELDDVEGANVQSPVSKHDMEDSHDCAAREQYLQIAFNRQCDAVCSPKATKVAEAIITCLEKNMDPEHWLDDLDEAYHKQRTISPIYIGRDTIFAELKLPLARLILVQDVLRPGDLNLPDVLESSVDNEASILSKAALNVTNMNFSARIVDDVSHRQRKETEPRHNRASSQGGSDTPSPPAASLQHSKTFNVAVDEISLVLQHASSAQGFPNPANVTKGLPAQPAGTVLKLSLKEIDMRGELPDDHQAFSLHIHETSLGFVSSAAELVTGTVHSWFIVARNIELAVLEARYRPISHYRKLVANTLAIAHTENITTDPLFLNRPTSAAVQLRSETSWKVLAHVRHNLRRISQEGRDSVVQTMFRDSNARDDYHRLAALLQEWHNWELDDIVIRRLGLVRLLFEPGQLAFTAATFTTFEAKGLPGQAHSETDAQIEVALDTVHIALYEGSYPSNFVRVNGTKLYATQKTSQDSTALVRLSVDKLVSELDPGLIRLVRHVARVRRVFSTKLAPLLPRPRAVTLDSNIPGPATPRQIPVTLSLLIRTVSIATSGTEIRLSTSFTDVSSHSTALYTVGRPNMALTEGKTQLSFSKITLQAAQSPSDPAGEVKGNSTGMVLISIVLDDVCAHAGMSAMGTTTSIGLLCILGSSRIRIPRSLLKMSNFLDQWRSETLPQSKIAFEELRKDLERQDRQVTVPVPAAAQVKAARKQSTVVVTVDLQLPIVSFHIRAAQTFWMDYTINGSASHARVTHCDSSPLAFVGGMMVKSQSLHFIAVNDSRWQDQPMPFGGDNIRLPAFYMSASHSKSDLAVLVSLDKIAVTVTASILDNVLAVQNRFEQDIDEILAIFQQQKLKKQAASPHSNVDPVPFLGGVRCNGQLVLRGLNLGLKGPLSTQFIGADVVSGSVSHIPSEHGSQTSWETSASNLALSLAQAATLQNSQISRRDPLKASFDRTYRLAYFVLDVKAGNRTTEVAELKGLTGASDSEAQSASHLHVKIAKMHAVMQTAAIEALDDLLEHFIEEISSSKQARAEEIIAIKDKVRTTFDIQERSQTQKGARVRPWIERCIFSLRVDDIGVAIPLQDVEIEAPFFDHPLPAGHHGRPAFLVAVPSLLFATSKGNAGVASVTEMSAQFIRSFDQTKPRHFSGSHHSTQNRLLLPQSTLRISSEKLVHTKAKNFTVKANMSGAQLDIDGSLANAIFALVDLYNLSYTRLARHAAESLPIDTGKSEEDPEAGTAEAYLAPYINANSFEASFEVESGVIRMYSKPLARDGHNTSTNVGEATQRQRSAGRILPIRRSAIKHETVYTHTSDGPVAPDSFRLPRLSMWAIKKPADKTSSWSSLHIDAVIHESKNTLLPSLLPFLAEISDSVKQRMHSAEIRTAARPSADTDLTTEGKVTIQEAQEPTTTVVSGLRDLGVTFSLSIARSALTVSCGDISTDASVRWESGGLIVALEPGNRGITATLRVDEVTFQINHRHDLSSPCIRGVASNLILAVCLTPQQAEPAKLSVDFNTSSLIGHSNFRKFDELLCFKAVWLDRLGHFVPASGSQVNAMSEASPNKIETKSTALVMIVLARIERIELVCELGNIATIVLQASNLVGRLRQVPRHSRAFSVDLEKLQAEATRGRLRGNFINQSLYFESYLHDIYNTDQASLRNCTNISIRIGDTSGAVDYDSRKTLLFRTEPIRMGVADDWSKMHTDQQLDLDFSLRFGTVSMMATTQTLPTMLKVGKDVGRLLAERRAKASDELLTKKNLDLAKSTADTAAELKDLKTAWKARTVLPSVIPDGTRVMGKVDLEADRLRLAIFLYHFTDQEAFRADAGNIKAHLSSATDAQGALNRDLQLRLGFFSVKKLLTRRVAMEHEANNTLQDWFDYLRASQERNIVRFPDITSKMDSKQEKDVKRIEHHFSLRFEGRVDISLNYALIKQMGELNKAYQEAMLRVKEDRLGMMQELPPVKPLKTTEEASGAGSAPDAVRHIPAGSLPEPKSVDVVGDMQYVALNNDIQQPQLQLLGDATPPLEWLGLQTTRAPPLVHQSVTVPLEKVLIELSAIYRKALSKASSIN